MRPAAARPEGCIICTLVAPDGWSVERLADAGPRACFDVTPPASFADARLTVRANAATCDFLVLSPEETSGFPAGTNVDKCPRCQARKEACICEK